MGKSHCLCIRNYAEVILCLGVTTPTLTILCYYPIGYLPSNYLLFVLGLQHQDNNKCSRVKTQSVIVLFRSSMLRPRRCLGPLLKCPWNNTILTLIVSFEKVTAHLKINWPKTVYVKIFLLVAFIRTWKFE